MCSSLRLSTIQYIYIPQLFIHLSVDGYLGCFHVLAIIHSAAENTRVHVFFSLMVFTGYVPSCGISVSYISFIPGF